MRNSSGHFTSALVLSYFCVLVLTWIANMRTRTNTCRKITPRCSATSTEINKGEFVTLLGVRLRQIYPAALHRRPDAGRWRPDPLLDGVSCR